MFITCLQLAGELVCDKQGIKGVSHLTALFWVDGDDILCLGNGHPSLKRTHPLGHISANDVERKSLLLNLVGLVVPEDVLQVRIFADQSILCLLPLLRASICFLEHRLMLADGLKLVASLAVEGIVQAEERFALV